MHGAGQMNSADRSPSTQAKAIAYLFLRSWLFSQNLKLRLATPSVRSPRSMKV